MSGEGNGLLVLFNSKSHGRQYREQYMWDCVVSSNKYVWYLAGPCSSIVKGAQLSGTVIEVLRARQASLASMQTAATCAMPRSGSEAQQ